MRHICMLPSAFFKTIVFHVLFTHLAGAKQPYFWNILFNFFTFIFQNMLNQNKIVTKHQILDFDIAILDRISDCLVFLINYCDFSFGFLEEKDNSQKEKQKTAKNFWIYWKDVFLELKNLEKQKNEFKKWQNKQILKQNLFLSQFLFSLSKKVDRYQASPLFTRLKEQDEKERQFLRLEIPAEFLKEWPEFFDVPKKNIRLSSNLKALLGDDSKKDVFEG